VGFDFYTFFTPQGFLDGAPRRIFLPLVPGMLGKKESDPLAPTSRGKVEREEILKIAS
jgi:hypothetical protein